MDRLFGTTVQRRAVRAFTVIEVLVALLLAAIFFSLIWSFWSTARRGEEQLATGFSAQQDLVLTMQRIGLELQEGIDIFYPTADGTVQSGLAFVTVNGRAVAYFVEPGTDGKAGQLYRVDLGSKEKKLVAQNVSYFKVSVEPPAPGKKPCLANLNLAVLRGSEDVAGKADDFNIVRKVFLRNLAKEAPE